MQITIIAVILDLLPVCVDETLFALDSDTENIRESKRKIASDFTIIYRVPVIKYTIS
jgi:hypothetical protein